MYARFFSQAKDEFLKIFPSDVTPIKVNVFILIVYPWLKTSFS